MAKNVINTRAGKAWLRVWGVARGVAAILWRAITALITALESAGSGGVWREVHCSAGWHPGPTLRRFQYLRARGVRCRLRSMRDTWGGGHAGMVSLRVHRDDLNRAYHLLTEIRE